MGPRKMPNLPPPPAAPEIPTPPAPPSVDDTAAAAQAFRVNRSKAFSRQKTVLGGTTESPTQLKTLLGQ